MDHNLSFLYLMVNHLEKSAEGCEFLVLWLDNDNEGENICFEVIDIVNQFLNRKAVY